MKQVIDERIKKALQQRELDNQIETASVVESVCQPQNAPFQSGGFDFDDDLTVENDKLADENHQLRESNKTYTDQLKQMKEKMKK